MARDNQSMAAMLLRFPEYIVWQDTRRLPTDGSPLVIGVARGDSLTPVLESLLAENVRAGRAAMVGSHPILLRYVKTEEDLKGAHLFFVSRDERVRRRELLAAAVREGVVTVSDAAGFIDQGGVIGFLTVTNRLKVECSMTAARAINIHLKPALLRPSFCVRVRTEGTP